MALRNNAKNKLEKEVLSEKMEAQHSPEKSKPVRMKETQSSHLTEDDELFTEDEFSESVDNYTISDSDSLNSKETVPESVLSKSDVSNRSRSSKRLTPEQKKFNPSWKPSKNKSILDGTDRYTLNNLCICIGFGLIFIIVMVFNSQAWFSKQTTDLPDLNEEEQVENLQNSIQSLKSKYHKQLPRTWKVIGSAVKAVIKLNSLKQPSVIMLGTLKEAKNVVECLTKELEKMIKNVFNENLGSVTIDGSKEISGNSMYEQLETAFKKGVRLAIIDNFEKLSGNAAQKLHAFCDHENAPYKNVIIILVVRKELNETFYDVENRLNSDKFVSNYLQNLWEESLGADTSLALLSRIANRVALISPEKFENLKSHCDI